METTKTFEDDFKSLCELLGESTSKLFQQLGKPDDIDEDENRAYVCFNSNHSHFGFSDDTVFRLQMPIADSSGKAFQTNDAYYTFQGLKIGMSKDEVLEIWGQPKSEGYFRWGLGRVQISNGNDIDLFIGFTEVEEDVYFLSSFEASLVEREPFEDVYIKVCDFIGWTESELVNKLGNPDRIDSHDDTNKYLFYFDQEVLFEISRNRGVIICATIPIKPDKRRIKQGYYDVLGAKVGDSVERVYKMWGEPSSIEGKELIYNTRLGTTSRGHNFETRLAIKDGLLEDFSGIMYIQPSKKSKSGCFVATACYGNYDATEVLVLREFRDNVLLRSSIGIAFVKFYYYVSPPLARIIAKSPILKTAVRKGFLAPLIRKIESK